MEHASIPEAALKLAIGRIGSQAALARLCGVKQPSVWGWLRQARRLPAEHVLAVESETGVSRHDLRPDIYPRDLGPAPVSQLFQAESA